MAEVFRGLYRTIVWAYVTNGMMAFQASEAEYRAFGYEPDYDNLDRCSDLETNALPSRSRAHHQRSLAVRRNLRI
jgi:hypothetical protein